MTSQKARFPAPSCMPFSFRENAYTPGTVFRWTYAEETGFTLVELMVVIAMLGILSGIGTMNYVDYLEKARILKAVAEIEILEKEIMAYQMEYGSLPQTLADMDRQDLLDPWGNPYEFLNFDTVKGKGKMRKNRFLVPINKDYDLYSKGPDGRSVAPLTAAHSRDDIIRADDGEYVGPASDY